MRQILTGCLSQKKNLNAGPNGENVSQQPEAEEAARRRLRVGRRPRREEDAQIVKLVNDFDEKCRSADAVLSAQLASLREFKDATFAACKG